MDNSDRKLIQWKYQITKIEHANIGIKCYIPFIDYVTSIQQSVACNDDAYDIIMQHCSVTNLCI
jgi:hypothetical protein